MLPSLSTQRDVAVLLNELKNISNKYSLSRYESEVVTSTVVSKNKANGHKELTISSTCDDSQQNVFLQCTSEKSCLNQYWYSKATIQVLCDAIKENCGVTSGKRVAFLSTPSLFFSLSEKEREDCTLFDFDRTFNFCSRFHFYDYNDPTNIDLPVHGQFDLVVIDPPFISKSVWKQYAVTAKLLLKSDASHVLATTVDENADLMEALFGCKPVVFRPSIPKLVYQYSVFVNFPSAVLNEINSELE